ncbi:MAG: DUF6705 family protein [Flavobacterium sp.]
MKTTISLLILLLGNALLAQQYPILSNTSLADYEHRMDSAMPGNYAMDTANERQQYVGLWEYNQNGILFQLKIEKADQAMTLISNSNSTTYSYADVVVLRYRLVKNGVELFNNLAQTSVSNYDASGIKLGNEDFLKGYMTDFTRNVYGYYEIKNITPLQQGVTQKILYEMILGNYVKGNPDSFYQDGQPLFSIPLGPIEMVKIN